VLVSELVALPYIRWIKRRQMAVSVSGLPEGASGGAAPPLQASAQDIDSTGGKHGEGKQTEYPHHLGR
jgi:hypothetical protein